MLKLFICLLAIVGTGLALSLGRKQSSGARGLLTCNGKPASNVLVKLYDDDKGIDADDLMATTKSDAYGRFQLSGHTSEFTTIDPKINIYHDCNDGAKPCQRKITIYIPNKYVSKGKTATKIYDAGTIELAGKFKGESRDCVH